MIFALFPQLRERRGQMVGMLSGGSSRCLRSAEGLLRIPSLMLDEPSMGLAPPLVVDQIFESILQLHKERKLTILWLSREQRKPWRAATAATLETGRIILQGSGEAMMANPLVRSAYLGAA